MFMVGPYSSLHTRVFIPRFLLCLISASIICTWHTFAICISSYYKSTTGTSAWYGFCKKAPQIRLDGLKNRNLCFFYSSGDWKCQQSQFLVSLFSWICRWLLSAISSHGPLSLSTSMIFVLKRIYHIGLRPILKFTFTLPICLKTAFQMQLC